MLPPIVMRRLPRGVWKVGVGSGGAVSGRVVFVFGVRVGRVVITSIVVDGSVVVAGGSVVVVVVVVGGSVEVVVVLGVPRS